MSRRCLALALVLGLAVVPEAQPAEQLDTTLVRTRPLVIHSARSSSNQFGTYENLPFRYYNDGRTTGNGFVGCVLLPIAYYSFGDSRADPLGASPAKVKAAIAFEGQIEPQPVIWEYSGLDVQNLPCIRPRLYLHLELTNMLTRF